ncbi:MAG TPA: dihydrolipoamide acetyltransferase family protein [Syntrophomonadaceae bacterium]|nr:dihydrolipoamide acetyltransferase family protein [Syntrophomonadaceae bacterium]
MATALVMPKMGLSMKTGTVGKWLVNEGDTVKKGDPVAEVMTDKITNKVEATADGVLLKIVAQKGSKLPVLGLMAVIGETGEDISEVLASAPTAEAPKAKAAGAAAPAGGGDERETLEVRPYEGMRKAIGDNMINSWTTAAKVTHMVDVDMSGMMALRKSINEGADDKNKVSVTALLIKAIARAIEIKPSINAILDGEEIKVLKEINIGMAVALDDGLIVPPIRNANTKKLDEVNKEVKDLAKRGRKNKLSPDEMVGSTFTITNVGAYNSVDHFTPIINQPELAILGIGRTVQKPVVVNGEIVIRPMMGLSLSFDHRVIDGAPAAEWLGVLINLIEHPHKIFI